MADLFLEISGCRLSTTAFDIVNIQRTKVPKYFSFFLTSSMVQLLNFSIQVMLPNAELVRENDHREDAPKYDRFK